MAGVDIASLMAANPGLVRPAAADGSDRIPDPQVGGVEMNPEAAPAAAPIPVQVQMVPAPKETINIGVPPEPVLQTTGAPAPVEATPVEPVATQPPPPDYTKIQWENESLRGQVEAAQARLQQAEQDRAWRAQNEPYLKAVNEKMPEILGLQERLAETAAAKELAEAKYAYGRNLVSTGQVTDQASLDTAVNTFEQTWRRDYENRQAIVAARTAAEQTARAVERQFAERDARDQRQQQEYAQKQQQTDAVRLFNEERARIEKTVPALKDHDGLMQLVGEQWWQASQRAGKWLPIDPFAAPLVNALRQQSVAAQAAAPTKAEVHAALPKTVNGGSGAPAPTGAKFVIPPGAGSRDIARLHRQYLRQHA